MLALHPTSFATSACDRCDCFRISRERPLAAKDLTVATVNMFPVSRPISTPEIIEIETVPEKATKTARPRDMARRHRTAMEDPRNREAWLWSLSVAQYVLAVKGFTEVPGSEILALRNRLFRVGWPKLCNLREAWIIKARLGDRPAIPYARLFPSGVPTPDSEGRVTWEAPPSGGLPPTQFVGTVLGWDEPAGLDRAVYRSAYSASFDAATNGADAATYDEEAAKASARDAASDLLRAAGRLETARAAVMGASFHDRSASGGGNPAQTWHKKRQDHKKALVELEKRLHEEGVEIQWGEDFDIKPIEPMSDRNQAGRD